MHWSAAYVGTPYAEQSTGPGGCHCWGLLCAAFRQEKGILLPTYEGVSPDALADIASIAHDEIEGGRWIGVTSGREFDVAMFHRGRFDSHFGIMIDGRHMLHSDKQAGGAVVERIDSGRWATTFAGFFRHRDLI